MPKSEYDKLILRHLYAARKATRTELAESLLIRKNTVGDLCQLLIDRGMIREIGDGRVRNAELELNRSSFVSIGLENRVNEVRFVLLDALGEELHRVTLSIKNNSYDQRVLEIIAEIRELIGECRIDARSVVGVGFSDFIPHDSGSGLKTKSIHAPGWGSVNIKGRLEAALGFPVICLRCTDARSHAEFARSVFDGNDTFITIQLDAGIGASVFKGGDFFRGSTEIFGEIGHSVYRGEGNVCKCGNRGCLETYAGTETVVRNVRDHLSNGVAFRHAGPSDDISLDDIIANAKEGNKLALLVLNEAATAVGDTLANVVNLLGITRIVIYGDLAKAGDLLLENLRDSIGTHCVYPLNQEVEIRLSELDEYACAVGAGLVVLRRHFGI
jgi:predicted NBD/HSP70 family sugar kinase